jgi:hypothetical protein
LPDEQISKRLMIFLSSPRCKNISLRPSGKSSLQLPPSRPTEGRSRDRHERGAGCGGRGRRWLTNGADADGEVVWS